MESFQIEYLHILPPNIGRTYRFLKFMNKNFDTSKHKFLVTAIQATVVNNYTKLLEFTDINFLFSTNPRLREANLKEFCKKSKHIIWHTLKSPNFDIISFLKKNPSLLAKSVWIEQGFDIWQDGRENVLKERIMLKKGDYVRRRFPIVASSFPFNADIVHKTYGKEPIIVTYPPNEAFYELAVSPFTTKCHGDKYKRLIQLCTDTRIYSRIHPLLIRMTKKKKKDRRLKESIIFLPSNITIRGDNTGLKCKKEYLAMAKRAAKNAAILDCSYQPEEYINYNRLIDALIIDPKSVIYPEYVLAPIFCGVKVYYPSDSMIAPYLRKASVKCGNVSCMNYETYRRYRNDDDLKSIFAVFDRDMIKSQWQKLFDSIN